MENPAISVCLFLLLRLATSPVTANQTDVTTHPTAAHEVKSTPGTESRPATSDQTDPFYPVPDNATGADCLIDTEMGVIAVASAGALILCLLITTVALGCQVCYLQRRVRAPRHSRSNVDLVSGTGYWGTDRPEAEGLMGPCDASVMLEEVRADREAEEEKRKSGEEPGEAGLEEGAMGEENDGEDIMPRAPLPSSSSRDSCMDNPRDLEDMPLVV